MNNLLKQYFETKDIKFVHQWVAENMNFFHDIVHKTTRRNNVYNASKEDLFSEAIIIFYDAIDAFDPNRGEFTTYMYKVIGNGLINIITHQVNKDFSTRVGAISLDAEYGSSNGAVTTFEEIATKFHEDKLMIGVLAHALDEYVKANLPLKKRKIYHLYKEGLTIPSIAANVGVSKQYVSKVLKDLVNQVREEWQVE